MALANENNPAWDLFIEEINSHDWDTYPQLEIIYRGAGSAVGELEGVLWEGRLFGWSLRDQGDKEYVSISKCIEKRPIPIQERIDAILTLRNGSSFSAGVLREMTVHEIGQVLDFLVQYYEDKVF